jgi:GNAT superfamily N-acetyltransferase
MASDSPDEELQIDPALLAAWVKGWALTRDVAPPMREGAAWRVEVGLPEQKRRLVFDQLSDAVRDAVTQITEPWVYLKVCAPRAAVAAVLPPRWSVQAPSWQMTIDGPMAGAPQPLAHGYSLSVERAGDVLTAQVMDADGAPAARGRLARVGDLAVYDRIRTEDAHQRRGLGSAVMRALETAARDLGCGRGSLAATQDGRALYLTLGWRVASPYVSAVIEG